jgi:3-hydroxyisobutyrate dehydrogenase
VDREISAARKMQSLQLSFYLSYDNLRSAQEIQEILRWQVSGLFFVHTTWELSMHIGIAGTGKMGTAIGKRLLATGHRLTVWNRSPERTRELIELGATQADSPRDLVSKVDAVITMLTDGPALDRVYFGADGLLSGPVASQLMIDMSTVSPAKQQEIGARVAAAGATYVECPVGGSVGPAQEGKLLGFAGGSADDLARAQPLLEKLCRRVEHVGPLGAGATMKLAINLPLMVYWQTLGEALSLIQSLNLDPERVIDILSDTSGAPSMLKVRGPMIAQALAGDKNSKVTVNVSTMRKDLRAMLDQAGRQNYQLPLTALALQCFDRAADNGLDSADCTQLPVWWLGEGGKV